TSACCNGDWTFQEKSATLAYSFGVVENRAADFGLVVLVPHRVVDADDLASSLAPALDQAEANPLIEHRREANRCDVALVRLWAWDRSLGKNMSARTQAPRLVGRLDTDDHLPVRRNQCFTPSHHAADEVLFLGHHLAEAAVIGRGCAVELGTGDMPLLDAHDAERFGTVRRHSVGAAGDRQGLSHRRAVAGRHRTLEGRLTGEREAEKTTGTSSARRCLP